MEHSRFDLLTRRLAARLSRRGVLGVLLGGAAAFAGGGASAADPARTVCRAANAACRTNAQCCSGICDTGTVAHRTRRNRCGCPAPLTPCGSQCADTQTSDRNCGACGRRCPAGQQCRNGACWTPSCVDSDAVVCLETTSQTIIELDHTCGQVIQRGCQSNWGCERLFAEMISISGEAIPEGFLDSIIIACVIGGRGEGEPYESIPEGLCMIYFDTFLAEYCGD